LFELYINAELFGILPSDPIPVNVVTVNVSVALAPDGIIGISQVIVFPILEAEPLVVEIDPELNDNSGFTISVKTVLKADSAPVLVKVILYWMMSPML